MLSFFGTYALDISSLTSIKYISEKYNAFCLFEGFVSVCVVQRSCKYLYLTTAVIHMMARTTLLSKENQDEWMPSACVVPT